MTLKKNFKKDLFSSILFLETILIDLQDEILDFILGGTK